MLTKLPITLSQRQRYFFAQYPNFALHVNTFTNVSNGNNGKIGQKKVSSQIKHLM